MLIKKRLVSGATNLVQIFEGRWKLDTGNRSW